MDDGHTMEFIVSDEAAEVDWDAPYMKKLLQDAEKEELDMQAERDKRLFGNWG